MSFDFFDNPPVAYRLAPFWFWNDNMDAQEIVHQIQEMAEKGVGGFFICARQGLEVPYLSEQWFHCVAIALEAAQQHGLHVWLYDEYPYPSGMSGGEVTLQHPDARHSQLLHHSFSVNGPQTFSYELPWSKVLIARAVPLLKPAGVLLWSRAVDLIQHIGSVPAETVFQSTGLTKYTNKRFFTASPKKRLVWDVPPGRWQIMLFLEEEIENFKYYGTYVDPCHKEAVQTFLETTHEQYARRFCAHFGRAIKGMFTDEVGLLGDLPWSRRLADFVRKRRDEDLIANLPRLFYLQNSQDRNDCAQARYQFFQSLHQLLNESYHQQVSAWCEQHQLQYTTEVPSMRMTTQLYSHMPGGDSAHEKVGRSLEWIVDANAYNMRADPKVVSSLARQLGAERAMIECFHSVGWSMTLQDAKWMFDRLAALGINFFVLHAFFYSISGLRKHDAPPSQFLQNPYWRHYRQLADYAGRLCYALSQGEACNAIAVVHPVTSFWTHLGNPFKNFRYCGNDTTEEQALERLKQDWAYLCKQLLLHQVGYDHLDPEMLVRATVKDGRLVIGRARYEVLILPPMTNLEAAAWLQIKAFLQAGGKVIGLGLLPYERIEPHQDNEAEILQWFGLTASPRPHYWREPGREQSKDEVKIEQAGEVPWTKGDYAAYFLPETRGPHMVEHLLALLQQCVFPTVLLEPLVGDRKSFLMHQRELPDGSQLIFITHQEGTKKELRLHLAQSSAGALVERLDLASGERTAVPAEETVYGRAVLLSFAPYESHLLYCRPGDSSKPENTSQPKGLSQSSFLLSLDIHQQPWQLTAQQDNVLRFGAFHFAVDRENAGLEARWHEGQEGQSWSRVEVRPLINQCADIAATHALPVQFSQSFGLPMQSSLAYPLHCWYQATFVVEQLPPACQLVMDKDAIGGNYICYLNGHKFMPQDFAPVFPHGFQQQGCEVRQALKQGTNYLVVYVEAQSGEDGIRDPLYLSGPFGVFLDAQGVPVINEPPATGEPKSGVQPGYPYFAGTLCFTREVSLDALPSEQGFALALHGWDQRIQDCVEVLVNGHSLGVCCWSPYRWEGETTILCEGNNEIEIRVTNTLSSMLEGSYFDAPAHQILPIAM